MQWDMLDVKYNYCRLGILRTFGRVARNLNIVPEGGICVICRK